MEINFNPTTKINELTVSELKALISDSIRETLEDIIEDREALSSKNYIDSIREAREEYKSGKVTKLEDLTDV